MALTLTSTTSAQRSTADLRERANQDEESCIATLRTINVAQITYWGGDDAKGFARTLGDLGPTGAGLIDVVMASGKKNAYRFLLTPERNATNRPIRHYTIIARPIRRLSEAQRSFFTDETGVIRFTKQNRAATVADRPLDSASSK